jgi:Ca-activated chloride channel homolog
MVAKDGGMMRSLILLFGLSCSWTCSAYSWVDLWLNADQRAHRMMEHSQFAAAKDTFLRHDWRGAAAYKAGDYKTAAQSFAEMDTLDGHYNQGNALAHLGQYEKAIAAYDKALTFNAHDKDTLFNRKLVMDLMKQDKQKEQNQPSQAQAKTNKKQQQKSQSTDSKQQEKNQHTQNNNNPEHEEQSKQDKNNQQQQQQPPQANKRQNKKQEDVQSNQNKEQQQAKEQWLRLIPDDPGGLMREKFLRDHLRRKRGWYQ